MILSTSLMSLRFSARGSLTSIAITFQSVSPFNPEDVHSVQKNWYLTSSIIAKTPKTLTWTTEPLGWIFCPISQTSIGSLSPLQLVDGSVWFGSWEIYLFKSGKVKEKKTLYLPSLRDGTVVPDVSVVGEAVCNISKIGW